MKMTFDKSPSSDIIDHKTSRHLSQNTVCIFCCKITDNCDASGESAARVDKFLKLLGRFLQTDLFANNKWYNILKESESLGCCEDCGQIINSFCDTYHQIKCLELKLEWRLRSLMNIMSLAGRVPSRTKQLKCFFVKKCFLKPLKLLRAKIINKCSHKLSESWPRVVLETEGQEATPSKTPSPYPRSDKSQYFLGWIMSFVAVAMLTTTKVEFGSHSSVKEATSHIILDTNGDEDNLGYSTQEKSNDKDLNDEGLVHTTISSAPSSASDALDIPHNVEVSATKQEPFEIVPESPLEDDEWTNETTPVDLEISQVNSQLPSTSGYNFREKEKRTQESSEEEPDVDNNFEPDFSSSSSSDDDNSIDGEVLERHGNSRKTRSDKGKKRGPRKIGGVSTSKKSLLTCQLDGCHRFSHSKEDFDTNGDEDNLEYSIQEERNERDLDDISHNTMPSPLSSASDDLDIPHDVDAGATKKEPSEKVSQSLEDDERLNVTSNDDLEKGEVNSELPSTSRYNFRKKGKRTHESSEEKPEVDNNFEPDFSSSSSSDDDNNFDDEEPKKHKNSRKTRSDKGKRRGHPQLHCQLDGCRRLAHSKEDFDDHQRYHANGQFKCQFCEAVEENVMRLSIHEHSKHSIPPKEENPTGNTYFCPRCPFQTMKFWRYKYHFVETHIPGFEKPQGRGPTQNFTSAKIEKNSEPKPSNSLSDWSAYSCPEDDCLEKFRTKNDLESHQKLHGSFPCNFCDIVKQFAPELAIHEAQEHAIRREEELEKRNGRGFKPFYCSRCSTNYFQKGTYIQHFLSAHLLLSSLGRSCPICKMEFTRRYYVTQHFSKYHKTDGLQPSEIFRCDLCPAYFIHGNQLYIHKMRLHFQRKCPKCGKALRSVRGLRNHLARRHPDFQAFSSFVFKCDLGNCQQKFTSQVMLNRHKRLRHDSQEISRVKCAECGRDFQDDKKLRSHTYRFHSGNRFVCSECGKSFGRKRNLELHQLYHKGPDAWEFECSTCKRKFADKWKLEQHQRTHTKKKPYVCQYCGEKYAHRHNWRNHVKTKHPKEYDQDEEIGGASKKKSGAAMLSRKGSKKGDCILAGVHQK